MKLLLLFRVLKIVLILFLFLLLLYVLFFSRINTALIHLLSEEPKTIDAHIALLEPFLEITKPETSAGSSAVFPVVVIVPGCLHTISHNSDWHDFFNSLGYATVVLDSFASRGITDFDGLLRTCLGRAVRGFDRAGDIYAVVEYLKRQDWADPERIALAGWSHGGWAIMDAMAFHSKGKSPHTLTDTVPNLSGVDKIILFYSYCGIFSYARSGFSFDAPTEVLHFIAGSDSSTDITPCITWHESQDNPGVRYVMYDGAEHTFDIPPPHNRNPKRYSPQLLEESKTHLRSFLTGE